jgi:hypothetical protein
MRLWQDNRELVVFGLLIAVVGVLAAVLMAQNNWLTNVGFLVFGALISVFTTLLSERIRQRTAARDLARALYVELTDRVARCCFDAESPWRDYLEMKNRTPGQMNTIRLRKFVPVDPIIYPSSASQLGTLGNDAPQALVRFYYQLDAWRRDLENVASDSERNRSGVSFEAISSLAKRVKQTLRPGLRALQALEPLVEDCDSIDASAIAGYDEFGSDSKSTGTLRDRITSLLS